MCLFIPFFAIHIYPRISQLVESNRHRCDRWCGHRSRSVSTNRDIFFAYPQKSFWTTLFLALQSTRQCTQLMTDCFFVDHDDSMQPLIHLLAGWFIIFFNFFLLLSWFFYFLEMGLLLLSFIPKKTKRGKFPFFKKREREILSFDFVKSEKGVSM